MKLKHFSTVGVFLFAVQFVWHTGMVGAAEATPSREPIPAGRPPVLVEIPKSVFNSEPAFGRDPFFPTSKRRQPKAPIVTEKQQPSAPPPPKSQSLELKGMTGGIVLINNMTFAEGDEAFVKIPNGRVRIKVLEIREGSVLVQVEGEAEPAELKLKK